MENSNLIISGAPPLADAEGFDDGASEVEIRPFFLGETHHGSRLDRALASIAPEFSRSYLQQLIVLGAVTLNEQTILKTAHKVKAGDRGAIALRPTPQSQAFKAEPSTLDLVYQDDDLLVINKPAGLVVHPAPGNWSGTLMNQLLGMDDRAFDLPRAGIVHRLDKDTSGLMVVARTRAAMDALVQAIAQRTVKRQYLALAHGQWRGIRQRQVDAPIGRDPNNRLRMAVVNPALHPGKVAQTTLELLANAATGCLVKCTLQTGRTHQIRVHMASIGHPLVADTLYGGRCGAGMQRQALHATRLALAHPVTRQPLVFDCAPPSDFLVALEAWGLGYNRASF